MSMAHRGPSTALRAIVTLRTAALPAGVDIARSLGDEGRAKRHFAGACRRPSQRHRGTEAVDGPRWAIDMQFHISISNVVPPPPFARRGAGRARAGRSSVRRRTGASRAPWRAATVPGARCWPTEAESSSNARGVRPSRPDSADMRRRTGLLPALAPATSQPTDLSTTRPSDPPRANERHPPARAPARARAAGNPGSPPTSFPQSCGA